MTRYITKDQIRKGDHIRVTFKEKNGVTTINEGVVGDYDYDSDWFSKTKEGVIGDYLTFKLGVDVSSIELINRPLPTTPGTVFRATEIRGEKCDVIVLVVDEPTERVIYATANYVGGFILHYARHITAWEPLDG